MTNKETQKFSDSEGAFIIEVTAEKISEVEAEELPAETLDETSAKADLELTITELKAALEQAHQKESSQQQQIAELQSKLDEQKTILKQLQQNLEQAKSLKVELEETKKAALQLAEANSKLMQEVNAVKKQEDLRVKSDKKPNRRAEILDPIQTERPADFAANTWLL